MLIGCFFGELALMREDLGMNVRMRTVIATTTCVLVALQKDAFDVVRDEFKELDDVMAMVCNGIVHARNDLVALLSAIATALRQFEALLGANPDRIPAKRPMAVHVNHMQQKIDKQSEELNQKIDQQSKELNRHMDAQNAKLDAQAEKLDALMAMFEAHGMSRA